MVLKKEQIYRSTKTFLAVFMRQSKKTKCLIVCTVVCLVYFVSHNDGSSTIRRNYDMSLYNQPCHLPQLDPFSPDIMSTFRRVPNIQCENSHRIMFVDTDNNLQFNQTALDILNIKKSEVTCVCSSISRPASLWTDDLVAYKPSVPCGAQSKLNADFFHIQCEQNGEKVVMDALLTRINVNKQKYEKLRSNDNNNYSVLMLGLDSVSRSMSKRSLKKTIKYIIDELGAYDMRNYMKVGDNTYPNLVALLTGKFAYDANELPQDVCFQTSCDSLPLIWKNFSQKGYVTMFAEDRPGLNAFQYQKKGFDDQPTDHYMRVFWLAAALFHLEQPVAGFLEGKVPDFINIKSLNPYPLCLGNIPKFMVQLNYIKQFINTYKHIPYFSFNFFTEIAHLDINELSVVDDDFFNFFKWLKDDGHLDNTIVIFFADHGPRGGQVTHSLRMENSLPLLNILIPKRLKKQFPNVAINLEENQRRLTSTFDLHVTLRNILYSDYEQPSSFMIGNKLRGTSLFGKIPQERSCADANIPDHYCVCYRVTPVNITDDKMVPKIAEAIVKKINSYLEDSPDCVVLSLNKIHDVRKMSEALTLDHVIKPHFWSKEEVVPQKSDIFSRYTAVIETKPGFAQFYASVNVDSKEAMVISDDIDRINKYGNQSHCIKDHLLHPFCYCKDLLTT